MKFDRQKAFPYPVLRPSSDDYLTSEFQAVADIKIMSNSIEIEIQYAISSEEIVDEIEKGNAEYVSIISCRDTYFCKVFSGKEPKQLAAFDMANLRGEVKIEPYVVVRKEISSFSSTDINPEFGNAPLKFSPGDVLAQDDAHIYYIDRDLFKPITSVFDLVKNENLGHAEWMIGYDQDHIQIEVSPAMKETIDDARNNTKNKAILINSIYFAAVMQVIQKLKESAGEFEARKWAQVIRRQAHNKGIDIDSHDSYLIAERLMQYPLQLLDTYVFKGA